MRTVVIMQATSPRVTYELARVMQDSPASAVRIQAQQKSLEMKWRTKGLYSKGGDGPVVQVQDGDTFLDAVRDDYSKGGRCFALDTARGDVIPPAPGRMRVMGGEGSGDLPGHEFHGNQWTGGSGGSAEPATGILSSIQEADGGFTYSPVTGESPKTGFALSVQGNRERILPAKEVNLITLAQYAKDNADLLAQSGNYMGGWHNPKDDKVYLDVSKVLATAEEAEALARENKQLAYYDLEQHKAVMVQ